MKKIALISTFCDTKEKQNILKENIIKIKSLGIDIMAISPIEIPYDIMKFCDFFCYTKENPVFDWPEKAYTQWWSLNINGENMKMNITCPDYGYAGLIQIKRMADLALSMDYDMFFPMIYDLDFTPYVESIFNAPGSPYHGYHLYLERDIKSYELVATPILSTGISKAMLSNIKQGIPAKEKRFNITTFE